MNRTKNTYLSDKTIDKANFYENVNNDLTECKTFELNRCVSDNYPHKAVSYQSFIIPKLSTLHQLSPTCQVDLRLDKAE